MDRVAIARALAKAQAYRECGKQERAEQWAARLVTLLGLAGILTESALVQAAQAALTDRPMVALDRACSKSEPIVEQRAARAGGA